MTDVHGIAVAGGTFPAQIWHDYMEKATTGTPDHGFRGAARDAGLAAVLPRPVPVAGRLLLPELQRLVLADDDDDHDDQQPTTTPQQQQQAPPPVQQKTTPSPAADNTPSPGTPSRAASAASWLARGRRSRRGRGGAAQLAAALLAWPDGSMLEPLHGGHPRGDHAWSWAFLALAAVALVAYVAGSSLLRRRTARLLRSPPSRRRCSSRRSPGRC